MKIKFQNGVNQNQNQNNSWTKMYFILFRGY